MRTTRGAVIGISEEVGDHLHHTLLRVVKPVIGWHRIANLEMFGVHQIDATDFVSPDSFEKADDIGHWWCDGIGISACFWVIYVGTLIGTNNQWPNGVQIIKVTFLIYVQVNRIHISINCPSDA